MTRLAPSSDQAPTRPFSMHESQLGGAQLEALLSMLNGNRNETAGAATRDEKEDDDTIQDIFGVLKGAGLNMKACNINPVTTTPEKMEAGLYLIKTSEFMEKTQKEHPSSTLGFNIGEYSVEDYLDKDTSKHPSKHAPYLKLPKDHYEFAQLVVRLSKNDTGKDVFFRVKCKETAQELGARIPKAVQDDPHKLTFFTFAQDKTDPDVLDIAFYVAERKGYGYEIL